MLSVLISCLYNRLDGVYSMVLPVNNNVEYIVIVQGANNEEVFKFNELNFFSERNDIKVIFDNNVGVTFSRNKAIDIATGDMALFTDDDVTLESDFFELVLKSFSDLPECDFLTFNIESPDGDLLKPPLCDSFHNLRSILGVGTIQIAIRLNDATKRIKFPLDLGAGSKYPNCDEPVYLSKFIKSGKVGAHINKTICKHPVESSGNSLRGFPSLMSRFIAFRYIFGHFFGSFIFIVFILKNIKKFSLDHN
ncbi:glycosyltransferase family 2 protein [Shewanella psychropiezotolerans]|uniref:Glycosyltransferase family 2 protein n=1 Tax=Shewanella psychropiezotolerans TaxID=2593655 RepID=A0ABX5XBI8_9GAMM|nr:glycosyltransferase family 2 protein [Shewanella psychropiezotolerans]